MKGRTSNGTRRHNGRKRRRGFARNGYAGADGAASPVDAEAPVEELPLDGLEEQAAPASGLEQALDLLQAGGPVDMILVAMSVLATVVVLLKLWQFSRTNVDRRRNGRKALHLYKEGKTKEALAAHSSKKPGRISRAPIS